MIPWTQQLARRRRLIAAMIGFPGLLAALAMCAVEGWRHLRPQSELFAPPFVYSLADAIERNEVDQAYLFIRAGQDPSQPIAVRHPVLTRGRPVLVSPLLWAVATQNRDVVLMLLGFDARVDPVAAGDALCLAGAIGNSGLADLLKRHGAEPDPRCSNRPLGETPLLAFVPDPQASLETPAAPAL